jgi:hypothetical protein
MPIIGASGAVAGGWGASHVLPARLVSNAGAERSRLARRDAGDGGRGGLVGAHRWICERDGPRASIVDAEAGAEDVLREFRVKW